MLLLPGCLAWPRSAAGGAWAVWTGRSGSRETSCAIRGARAGDIGHRSPPGSSEELSWAGCGPGGPTWPLGRWVRWPVTPTGTGAGSSAPPPYTERHFRTGGCRPGAEAARVLGSWACAAAPSTYPGMGRYAPSFGKASSDRRSLPSHAHFHNLARSCADSGWRSSANQGRGSLFRHTGCTTQ
jgi:hypothetical protein